MACSRCSADRLRGWEGQTFSIRCWRWSFLLIIWGGAVLANRALGSHSPAQKGQNWTGTYWRRKFRQHCLTRDSAERKEFKPDNCTPPSGATVPSKSINKLFITVYHMQNAREIAWVTSIITVIIITFPCGDWNVRMLYTWEYHMYLCPCIKHTLFWQPAFCLWASTAWLASICKALITHQYPCARHMLL